MSLWIDIKYAGLISPRLDRFKVKQTNPYLANFRCPVCGDSQKNKYKARGFLYTKNNNLYYKCHNCNVGFAFGSLLKDIEPQLYSAYKMERYTEGLDMGNVAKPHAKKEFEFKAPVFQDKGLIDKLLDRLDRLPEDNPAVQYATDRLIPEDKFDRLYYVDDMQKIGQLSEKYKDRIEGTEDRLVLPFYDMNGRFVAVTCRALHDESLRYVTIRLNDDQPMIYNLDQIDRKEKVYCVEGPIDSLFLPNCVAVATSDLKKIKPYLPGDTVNIFDNQPRNPDIVRLMKAAQKDGSVVVVWPERVEQKDINEMIKDGGRTSTEVLEIINNHSYTGLSLLAQINKWSKC